MTVTGGGPTAASGTHGGPDRKVERTTVAAPVPGDPIRLTADDPDEAAGIVSQIFLDTRLQPLDGPGEMRMELHALQLGSITLGKIGFGTALHQATAVTENFFVNTPLSGSVSYLYGGERASSDAASGGLAFSPGADAQVDWSADCVLLCLMIPPARLEIALEQALGRTVRRPVEFDRSVEPAPHVARQWRALVALLANEVELPTGLGGNTAAGAHLESFVLDSLVLDHPHNYSDIALAPAARPPSPAVRRAVELIEERPEEPWSVVRLASEVHLSPRALQEGFSRDVGQPPMSFLRQVRLRRVHDALLAADPEVTSVRTVAFNHGFLHLGRFAATYRQAFGSLPSDTLHREAPRAMRGAVSLGP